MKYEDLIRGKYYKYVWYEGTVSWYFRFDFLKNNLIYSFGGYFVSIRKDNIRKDNIHKDDIRYLKTSSYILDTTTDIETSDYFEEINLKDIIYYLPDDNIDKINYLRKERIKILLNI